MSIKKLFQMQKILDERIYKEHDLRNKYKKEQLIISRILALIVETAECANENREFKFWSVDQKPRTFKRIGCPSCNPNGIAYLSKLAPGEYCEICAGFKVIDKNPLLEEYVDGLHFILGIGLELNYTDFEVWTVSEKSITNQFIECIGRMYNMYFQFRVNGEVSKEMYEHLVATYLGLGEILGFTWEQIEQAYMDKNKVNHQRQDNGY